MELALMRHGIAIDREHSACPPDVDRALTPLGIERTRRAARGLARLGLVPERVFTSPLVRARQTAELAARELRAPAELHETPSLVPSSQPDELLELLLELDLGTVLCVGHAPHLDLVVARLLGCGGPEVTRLKKAGVAWFEFDARGASLLSLLPPRALRLLGGEAD